MKRKKHIFPFISLITMFTVVTLSMLNLVSCTEPLNPFGAPLVISYPDSNHLHAGEYAQIMLSSRNANVDSFSIFPELPEGLFLHPLDGTISGTPEGGSPWRKYTVRAFDPSRSGSADFDLAVSPKAPSEIKVTLKDTGVVSISWRGVSGAEHYTLFRCSEQDTSFESIATAEDTSYSDSITQSGTYRYALTAHDGDAPASKRAVCEDEIEVIVSTVPVIVDHPEDLSVKVGSAAQFSIVAEGTNLSYIWQKDSEDIEEAQSSSNYTISETVLSDSGSSYRCIVFNSAGSCTSAAAILSVSNDAIAPSIKTEPLDRSVSAGDPVEFSIEAQGTDLQYIWQKDSVDIEQAASSATYTISETALSDSGKTYRCIVYNTAGSCTSKVAILSVSSELVAPTIKSDPQNQSVTVGERVEFSVEAQGADLSYIWQKDSVDIQDTASSAAYTISEAALSDSGTTYRCIVYNSAGACTSEVAILSVEKEMVTPTITEHPQNQNVTEGEPAEFSVLVEGTGLEYVWQKDSVDIEDAQSSSVYPIAEAALSDSGTTYRCVVSNAAGACTSEVAILSVEKQIVAPSIVNNPENQSVTEGNIAEFSVIAQGTDLQYMWQKDSEDIEGANSAMYTTPVNELADSGTTYRCIVFNSAGVCTSQVVILSVVKDVIAPSITQHPEDKKGVAGQSVTYEVTVEGTDISYRWLRNDQAIVDAQGPTYTIPAVSSEHNGDNYTVEVSNSRDTLTSDPAGLTVVYSVTYMANGADSGEVPVDTDTYEVGDPFSIPGCDLSMEGHTLSGWARSQQGQGNLYQENDELTMGANHDTLWARWTVDSYEVTFISDGGNPVPSQTVTYNTKVDRPADPHREGYTFEGWCYESGSPFDFETPVTGPLELYAYWEEIPKFRVVYHANADDVQGDIPGPFEYEIGGGDEVVARAGETLSRVGYTFNGWNTQANGSGTDYAAGSSLPTGDDIDLYAKWQPIEYTITYDLNVPSGEMEITENYNTTVYTIQSDAIQLYDASREGFDFKGWYSDYYLQDQVTEIPTGTTGNLRLYAKWEWGGGTVTDWDGNEYPAVQIGNKVWTTVNLRTRHYNDGTEIPHLTTTNWRNTDEGALCYHRDLEDTVSYGALYNWYAVGSRKLAPLYWFVSTKEDWDELKSYVEDNYTAISEAKALSAQSGWLETDTVGAPGNDLSANNGSGFSALPGGYCPPGGYYTGYSYGFESEANFWSLKDRPVDREAYYVNISNHRNWVSTSGLSRYNNGYSVRIVRVVNY